MKMIRSGDVTKQNREINLLKFIFAVVVFCYHFSLNYNFGLTFAGYIAVDYFFILSGIFLHRKLKIRNWKENPLRYLLHRYLHFLPYILFTFTAELILRAIREGGLTAGKFFQWIWDAKWELLCLYGVGLKSSWIFYPPLWFISSLLLMSFLICCLYWFMGQLFERWTFIISFVIYAFFFLTLGNIRAEGQMVLFFTGGTWRGLAGLCLGLSADRWIGGFKDLLIRKQMQWWRAGKSWNRIMRITAWGLTICVLVVHRFHPLTRFDFLFIGVMTCVFVLFFILEEPEVRPWRNQLSMFFGKLSMALYFNHNYLMEMPFWTSIVNPLIRAGLVFAAALGASLVSMAVIRGIQSAGKLIPEKTGWNG